MQKETRRNSAAGSAKPNPPRKLTRAEKKQIAEIIRQAKGDGKAHTAQQTIPYLAMYPDGICKVTEKRYSKCVVFEDINYQLAESFMTFRILQRTRCAAFPATGLPATARIPLCGRLGRKLTTTSIGTEPTIMTIPNGVI